MTLVYVSKNWNTYPLDLIRQTPNFSGVWNNIQFVFNPPESCDYVIVINHVLKDVSILCPPTNVWTILQEPPNELWDLMHRGDISYSRIYTTAPWLYGRRSIHSQPAIPWHVNRSYDWLKNTSIPTKTENLSCITSYLSSSIGSRKRLNFLDRACQSIAFDLYGRGFSEIEDKWDALAPYKYSIVMENFSNPYYWSEKIADCFLSWTMPIYYGCTRIKKFFPSDSLVCFDLDDPNAMTQIKEIISSNLWDRNIDAINHARNMVLEKYQLFPFLAEQIQKNENQTSLLMSRQPVNVFIPRRLRPTLDSKIQYKIHKIYDGYIEPWMKAIFKSQNFAWNQHSSDQLPTKKVRMSLAGKGQETSALTYELHHEPHKHSRKVNNLLANALELMRRYDVDEAKQAEVLLKKALEVEPNAADLLNTLAVSYQLQNRLDEAQALFEQIQIQQPDYILASVIPAQTHLLKGEIAEAEALLQPLLSHKRFHFDDFGNFSNVYLQLLLAQNNKEAAVGWLQLWQQATPDHPLITAWKIALRDQAQVLRAPL